MPAEEEALARLRGLLLSGGLRTSREMSGLLGVSQATMSRMLGRLGDAVLRVGQRRSTRYIGRREIRGTPTPLPIYEITPEGATEKFGILHPVGGEAHWIEYGEDSGELFEDLPYFLDGLRPAGYLGRFLPAVHEELANPSDIRNWSGDDTLRYLSRFGFDGVGAFIVGDEALQLFLNQGASPVRGVCDHEVAERYEQLVDLLLKNNVVGSSAGGEQPKFLVHRSSPSRQCLVKFTPHLHQVGRRLSDMMVCEHLALEELRSVGIEAAKSTLIQGKDRLFLEVERFDRTEKGRRGVVALEALGAEFEGMGSRGQWPGLCARLVEGGRLPSQVLPSVQFLSAFGRLIGNTDMHNGNLSFFMRGREVTGLTPAYDMLPMIYSPTQGHLQSRPLTDIVPRASDVRELWSCACDAARCLWLQVSAHPLVTKEFQDLAKANADVVARAKEMASRLPV